MPVIAHTREGAGVPEQGYRVEVTEDCISSGSCLGIARDHFVEGDDGYTKPVHEIVTDEKAKAEVLDAAECCPMSAIRVTDLATGEELAGP
jgi:ferredoxin